MMTREKFEQKFYLICQKHGAQLFLNDGNVDANNGYARQNEIHLGKHYRNVHIYMAIAFHELGHVIINQKRAQGIKRYSVNSCFMEEWLAWSIALRLYAKHIGRPFTQAMGNFVLQCLNTHSQSHYSFKAIYDDKMARSQPD